MKKALMFLLLLSLATGLFAWEYGFKAGLGSASLQGSGARYDIHYKLDLYDSDVLSGTEYVFLSSDSRKGGSAYEAGAFVIYTLLEGQEILQIQAELNWQKYGASFDFTERALTTDNLSIAESYQDLLSGLVNKEVHYLNLPLLLKLKQSMLSKNNRKFQDVNIFFGPGLGFRLKQNIEIKGGISSVEGMVDDFVADSLTDADPSRHYQSRIVQNGVDKLRTTKLDFILGGGFSLNDIFKLSSYEETWVIEGRLCLGLNDLGAADVHNQITLKSILVSLGMRF